VTTLIVTINGTA